MNTKYILIASLILSYQFCFGNTWGQTIDNVPKAFEAIEIEPETIVLENKLDVPIANGHLQGIQFINKGNEEKLLISGSSYTKAYIVQADINAQKVDKLISLMSAPFRHAGGIQATHQYVIVGIEDNYIKKDSKVCVYNYTNDNLYKAKPDLTIERHGEPEKQTSGATGLLPYEDGHLAVVANWDSRIWDFYYLDIENNKQNFLESFTAPDDWAGYQAVNLIEDNQAIYSVGFYKKDSANYADLILVTKQGGFKLVMGKLQTKRFNSGDGADFGSAAGLHVDEKGKLHVWSSQKAALKQIKVSKFSQK